jgi:hypothetical protein
MADKTKKKESPKDLEIDDLLQKGKMNKIAMEHLHKQICST